MALFVSTLVALSFFVHFRRRRPNLRRSCAAVAVAAAAVSKPQISKVS